MAAVQNYLSQGYDPITGIPTGLAPGATGSGSQGYAEAPLAPPPQTLNPGGTATIPATAVPTAPTQMSGTDFVDYGLTSMIGSPTQGATDNPAPPTTTFPTTSGTEPVPGGANTAPVTPTAYPAAPAAFDGSLAGFQSELTAGGWASTEDPNYWYGRMMATGGPTASNLAYWQSRIAAGPQSVQPGGAYYEAPASTSGLPDISSLLSLLTPPSGATPGMWSSSPTEGVVPTTPGIPAPDVTTPGGGDPLAGIAASGTTPFGGDINAEIASILASGGVTPNIGPSLINAREAEATGEQGQLADAQAQLAAAGDVSEPGVEQGPEQSAIERIQGNVGPAYASAINDITTTASNTQNANLMTALQAATGMSEAEANAVISAVGTGTQRQTALANIALGQLQQSDSWNEFLANYGISQATLQEQINQGNWTDVINLLTLYTQGATTAAGGGFLSTSGSPAN